MEKLLESQKQTGIIKLDIEESPRFVPTKPAASFFGDFIYNLDEAQPDVVVKNGGVLRQLNVFKLPILRKVGLGLTRLHLKASGFFPSFSSIFPTMIPLIILPVLKLSPY